MKIGILGTGSVGQTIGKRLTELGHEVMMGSRTADNPKLTEFAATNPERSFGGSFSDAAAFGELIFNCTRGEHAVEAVRLAGAALHGKTLVDVSNPLDFSKGMPPCLIPSLSNTHSLGEEIQQNFPEIKVVKTLNTMWCGIMVNPGLLKGDHTNFICGNDAQAKADVKSLLTQFGWSENSILDLGDITSARGTEAVLPVWLRIWGAAGTGAFNLAVVKA